MELLGAGPASPCPVSGQNYVLAWGGDRGPDLQTLCSYQGTRFHPCWPQSSMGIPRPLAAYTQEPYGARIYHPQ